MSHLTAEERRRLPLEDFGRPGAREFPVLDQEDLDAAARLIGRAPAPERPAIRRRIEAIARRRGLRLPASWGGKGDAAGVERKAIDFEVKAVSGDGYGSFEGIGAVFHNIDNVDDIIAKGAFAGTLPDFLANGFIGGVDHDWRSVIGHPAKAEETDAGLAIKGVFDDTPEAQAVRAKMTPHPETGRATIKRLSIGYRPEPGGASFLDGPDEIKAYWDSAGYEPTARDLQRATGRVRLLTRLKLFEVSPVLVAANDLAQTTGVKSAGAAGFADHSRQVASAAGDFLSEAKRFVDRFEARAAARLKDGRELSAANWAAFKEVLDGHKGLASDLAALSEKMAAILGRTDPGARGKSGGMTADDEASLRARLAQIMYATNPCLR